MPPREFVLKHTPNRSNKIEMIKGLREASRNNPNFWDELDKPAAMFYLGLSSGECHHSSGIMSPAIAKKFIEKTFS